MDSNFTLIAISPVDGRYYNQVFELSEYFSEKALMRYRVKVEIEYFIALCNYPLPQLKGFKKELFDNLRQIFLNFDDNDALRIKELEKATNHDVKAVEYFIKQEFDKLGIAEFKEFVHLGLTSQDINNTSQPLSIKEANLNVFFPKIDILLKLLAEKSEIWINIPLLSHTHGQPASPTTLGKEIMVFVERLQNQLGLLNNIPYSAKFGGAVGNFNAHHVAYPTINWIEFANHFVNEILGLKRSHTTTQIEHYDNLAAIFDSYKRINNILIDLCRDLWTYISMEYFKQELKEGEIGSSAMPHKVNPIDFENAEGNLGIANSLFEHLSSKLPISRLQRDLTDSTVSRNIGIPFAHSFIAYNSIIKGLNKLIVNIDAINKDLEDNWSVIAEAIQTILRREGYENPYETLKLLTRKNEKITKDTFLKFIDKLIISDKIKEELRNISPFNYIGIINKPNF